MLGDNSEMRDLDIYEIKLGGIDGISFRKNKGYTIKKQPPELDVRVIITDILYVMVGNQPQYQIFASKDLKGLTDPFLIKYSENIPVYVSLEA